MKKTLEITEEQAKKLYFEASENFKEVLFQFYLSSIKSILHCVPTPERKSFNSTLVQLKGQIILMLSLNLTLIIKSMRKN